ncbi:HprK-related kinase A [Rhodoferax sp.]|uniref:HprK-related kinase A n=1 Tax=Rhodoferax sp. TaxID=50421 RepID=UPI00274A171B|nr:HprK-related kinase A [Rhodoferax sp.]
MTLSELAEADLRARLRGVGLRLSCGPFNFRILSPVDAIADGLRLLYADYRLPTDAAFIDFTVTIERSTGIRRFWHPQVKFAYDGTYPFVPMQADHAFPLLEWAMNWCISSHADHYLMLHAAVLERDGFAVVMPAPPGSGKSTLCAGLASRGWRLLSDELALHSLTDGLLTPLARPISLKNESLDVIRAFYPGVVLNQVTHHTSKGSVSHMLVPSEHLARVGERARPRWVVFPKYVPRASAQLSSRSKAQSLLALGANSFNYSVLGLTGFEALSALVSNCDCYDFQYSQLEQAVATFDALAQKARA